MSQYIENRNLNSDQQPYASDMFINSCDKANILSTLSEINIKNCTHKFPCISLSVLMK